MAGNNKIYICKQCLKVRIEIQIIFTVRITNDLLWNTVESLLLKVLHSKSDVLEKYAWARPQDVNMAQHKILLMLRRRPD